MDEVDVEELVDLGSDIDLRREECQRMELLVEKFDTMLEYQKRLVEMLRIERVRWSLTGLLIGILSSMFFMFLTYFLYKKTLRLIESKLG